MFGLGTHFDWVPIIWFVGGWLRLANSHGEANQQEISALLVRSWGLVMVFLLKKYQSKPGYQSLWRQFFLNM